MNARLRAKTYHLRESFLNDRKVNAALRALPAWVVRVVGVISGLDLTATKRNSEFVFTQYRRGSFGGRFSPFRVVYMFVMSFPFVCFVH